MSRIRYAVWGRDRTFRWLWLAALVEGYDACMARYSKRTTQSHKDEQQREVDEVKFEAARQARAEVGLRYDKLQLASENQADQNRIRAEELEAENAQLRQTLEVILSHKGNAGAAG